MKKIILPLVGALLLSAGSIQAQQSDTTGNASKTKTQTTKTKTKKPTTTQDQSRQGTQGTDQARQSKSGQVGDQQSGSMNNSSGDLVIIQSSEVPASLRTTLQNQKYAGWENAIIYHNKTTGEYLTSPRPYRFDSQGKELSYQGGQYGQRQPGSQSTQGQTSTERGDQTGSGTEQTDANRQSGQRSDSQYGTSSTSGTQQGSSSTSGTTGTQQGSSSTSGTTGTTGTQQSSSDASSSQQQSDRYRTDGTQSGQTGNNQISTEGMTEIQSDEYPESLRTTLRGSQYQGWERGKMYRDDASGEYVLIMDGTNATSGSSTSGNTGATKTTHYRFDRNGKAVSGTNQSGGNNDNR